MAAKGLAKRSIKERTRKGLGVLIGVWEVGENVVT